MAKSLLDKRLSTGSTAGPKVDVPKKTAKSEKSNEKNLLSSRLTNPKNNTEVLPHVSRTETFAFPSLKDKQVENTNLGKKREKSAKNKKEEKVKKDTNIDNILDEEFDINESKQVAKYKTGERIGIAKKIIITIGCLYFAMLIFGVIITEYTYDDAGNAIPMAMSYSDLKALEDFEVLTEQYYAMQDLYEKMLDIDYQFYLSPSESTALSAEYEGLLEDVANVSIKTESISVSTSYNNIRSMMLSWIKTDIAVYLQNMSAAIAQNDTKKASNATQDRVRLQNNYNVITNNLVALGKKIKGMDVNKLIEWTPEKYNEYLTK